MRIEQGSFRPEQPPTPLPERLETNPERRAVVRYSDGEKEEYFFGPTHGDAMLPLEKKYLNARSENITDGFMTTEGRFVDRKEANEIAIRAGQKIGSGYRLGGLDSEDLPVAKERPNA